MPTPSSHSLDYLLQQPRSLWGYLFRKLFRPRLSYADWYAERLLRQLSGSKHRTLGVAVSDPEDARRKAQAALAALMDQGLRPEHRLVELGCGSLRLGEAIMAYLLPGRYIGLDITDAFFRAGLQRLPPSFVAERRPRLEVISQDGLKALAEEPPDFVFCRSVIHHVPPFELRKFLRNLVEPVGPDTRCILVLSRPGRQRRTEWRWWHSAEDVTKILAELGCRVEQRAVAQDPKRPWLLIARPNRVA